MSKRTLSLAVTGLAAALTMPAATAAFAQSGNQAVILRAVDADNYDPIRSSSRAAAEIVFLMADTLVSVDFDMQTIRPLLAERWEVSEDGRLYTFHLRDDVQFCDGRAMTAEDVVYSLGRWLGPDSSSPTRSRGGPVQEIRAVGDHVVEYELEEPYSDLLFQLSLSFSSIVDREAVEELGENFGVQGFGGTGPYCWNSWTPRQELVLDRNPHYDWGPPIYESPSPQIDRLVWRVIPEANTLMAAVQAGQADATYYMPAFALRSLEAIPTLTLSRQDSYIYDDFIGFKVDKPFVSDPQARRAIAMAVNREAMAQAAFFGEGRPLNSLLNPAIVDFDEASADLVPGYDPEEAASILEAAGWVMGDDGVREKDGQRAEFLLYGLRLQHTPVMTEAMQSDLRRVGVDMQIQLFDATAAWGRLATQEFGAFAMSYPAVTASEALSLYFHSRQRPTPNRMNWENEETDRLIEEARTATDDAARREALNAAQRQLTEANVWLPIVSQPMVLVTGQRIEGARAHGLYGVGTYKALDMRIVQ